MLISARGGQLPARELDEMIAGASSRAAVLVRITERTPRPDPSLARAVRSFFARHESDVAVIVVLIEARGFIGSFFLSLGTQIFAAAQLDIPTYVVTNPEAALKRMQKHGVLEQGADDEDLARLEAALEQLERA